MYLSCLIITLSLNFRIFYLFEEVEKEQCIIKQIQEYIFNVR